VSDASSKLFLGVGTGLPVAASSDGSLQRAAYEDSVRQSVWIILSTSKGERVMRPDFGCGIHDLVFAPNTPTTHGRLATAVREALLSFEPRVDVRDVRVVASGEGGEVLLLSVDYEVRATNNVFNLVYPFYLGGGT
jgi:phage baseplate assembly protein W